MVKLPARFTASRRRLASGARQFVADDAGATAVEYALLMIIILGFMVAMRQFSDAFNGMFAELTAFFGR